MAALSLIDLPQQGVSTQAEPGLVGVEKGVNAGQAVGQNIHYRNGHQLFFESEFYKLGICPDAGKKFHILVRTGVVHAAAGMSGGHVFAIEREVFLIEGRLYYVRLDGNIFFQSTFLAAVGSKLFNRNPCGQTGTTGGTMWPINKSPAATKTVFQQGAVAFHIHGGFGIRKQGDR